VFSNCMIWDSQEGILVLMIRLLISL
jgi:hypothetical protein